MHQLRKAANERRDEIQKKIRNGDSKDRKEHFKTKEDKAEYVKELKVEKGIRNEIGTIMKSLNEVSKIAFQS